MIQSIVSNNTDWYSIDIFMYIYKILIYLVLLLYSFLYTRVICLTVFLVKRIRAGNRNIYIHT